MFHSAPLHRTPSTGHRIIAGRSVESTITPVGTDFSGGYEAVTDDIDFAVGFFKASRA